jgi:sugar phosphate isomerase/epimerase
VQLAAITDEISQDFEHALDVLREYDIQGAELRGLWGTNIADLTDAQAERAQSALKARGMNVVALSTPFFKCDLAVGTQNAGEAEGRMHLAQALPFEKQIAMLKRCIELAQFFETPYLRVFSFWRKAVLTPEIEAQIGAAFQEPLALAEKADLTLLLENEHACFIGTGAEAARVAQAIASPHFKICWDPGNAFCADETPFPDGYEVVKPYFAHIHIKDAVMRESEEKGRHPQWCVVGEGEIDYEGHFAALKRDGYQGYLSLETHYLPAQGSAPDGRGTPEEGSRPCLAALRRLISE